MYILFINILFLLLALWYAIKQKNIVIKGLSRILLIIGILLVLIGLVLANLIQTGIFEQINILSDLISFSSVQSYVFEIAFYMSPLGIVFICCAIMKSKGSGSIEK